ncbi:ribosome-binding factor A [Mycoplasma haemocanis str. Illinois]|uniref:Ribosome-binding factor A n=1 Tax=Mycoplasma haemocanis (strain Illinois) TaxID=1111676 RepID=H6N8C9_MYCHN|nr:30S ribosome-binding factor RbfA [Mycoplasma haemocanis]AEW45901.1 ribosome-binding factor A [Mycoplasma haemocanis str. Illinois]
MESIEFKKFSKNLHRLLLKALQEELEDPVFKRVAINFVKVNRNKTYATIYCDLVNHSNPSLALSRLNRLSSFFKQFLSGHLGRYRVPNLKFVSDEEFYKANRIENLIDEAVKSLEDA